MPDRVSRVTVTESATALACARPAAALPPGVGGAPARRRTLRRAITALAGERGAATAEYAVATMAAVGFAGLLVVILRGDEVRGILTDLVRNALTVG
ncbi:hypothetical protein ABIC29_002425 [Agromyces sp. PvR057]